MLQTIKEQFKHGKCLTQSKYYYYVDRGLWPKFYWDLLPLAQEYYHELNPYFLFNYYRPELFKFSKCVTVRDGYLTFSSFMLDNFKEFLKLTTGPLIIHPDLAPIVPPTLSQHFASWQYVQRNQIRIEDAKRIIVFGVANKEYLGDLENLSLRLEELVKVHPEASIEVFLPMRKEIFGINERESLLIYQTVDHIKNALPNRKLKFLTSEQFFEISDFKHTFVFDLAVDRMLVSDNYVHYFVQSRGGTVNNGTLGKAPKESMFHFDVSIHHELHLSALPRVESIFSELLFFKKLNPGKKEFHFHPTFQKNLRALLTDTRIRR